MKPSLLFLGICLLMCSCTTLNQRKKMQKMSAQVLQIVNQYPEAQISVFYSDIPNKNQLAINADSLVHAASTMKIPVMMEVYKQAAEGKLKLTDSLLVKNEFKSIVDGSLFSIGDDSDDFSYQQLGKKMSIRDLVFQMITVSSNLATNLLIDLVSAKQVQATIESYGTKKMQVLRGVEDLKAFDKGLSNKTTARDLGLLMQILGKGNQFPEALNADMLAILKAQKFNEMIPTGLPEGTVVAHKTGNITKHHHDAALVYPPNKSPYVLVILIKGIADIKESAKIGAKISEAFSVMR
jgi:beta-lactamase class A